MMLLHLVYLYLLISLTIFRPSLHNIKSFVCLVLHYCYRCLIFREVCECLALIAILWVIGKSFRCSWDTKESWTCITALSFIFWAWWPQTNLSFASLAGYALRLVSGADYYMIGFRRLGQTECKVQHKSCIFKLVKLALCGKSLCLQLWQEA